MSLINYTNINVSIGGTSIYATNASYSFQVPVEGVRSLGQKSAINTLPSGPVEGTLNIDYLVTNSDPGSSIFDSIINNPSTYAGTAVIIGGQTFSNAYLTSHTLSAEANSVASASVSFTVFGPGGGTMSAGSAGTAQNIAVGHGAGSTAVTNAISFEYNATVEWEAIYLLNSQSPAGITFRSARQSINARGLNIGRAISACPTNESSISVNIGAICGGSASTTATITNGKLISSESSVSANGYVEGSFEVVKEY